MLKKRLNQRGAGGIGCLFICLLVGAGIYAGIQYGMPQLRHRSFEDRLNETFTYFSRQPAENIRKRLIDVATDFDITLTPGQVRVDIQGDQLTIDINYEKVVDLKVWSKTMPFRIHRSGPY